MTALVWFRSDLRVDDNTALYNALQQHRRVAAVFYATPQQWSEHDMAPVKAEFLWRNLEFLRDGLARLNVPLHVRVVPRYDDVANDILALCAELRCVAVFANREYAVNEARRDKVVAQRLAQNGIEYTSYDDAVLLPPQALQSRQGQPYKVFTPFKRALLDLIGGDAVHCLAKNKKAEAWCEPPSLPAYPYETSTVPAKLWPAGERAARARLAQFVDGGIDNYHTLRDFPADDATSRLSPYLALGVISIRRCIEAALAANEGRWQVGNQGAVAWLNELIWREFYLHVLAHFPRVSMYRPLRVETERVSWRDDAGDFQAWCDGRTGFPFVDAAMRQLVLTGWMHNRLRMVCAMFLSKYLLLDWRRGEKFFMRHLIDGDLAANNGGWQWCASTGTDAAPYFRLL
ncbi:MAG TPA: FAD-binding domain-containing protein, partial [Spongiibacteraceae bacterium]|nr:FAD-binding domain-containing protein [Spongiibacteraceae bacterium]